MTFPTGLIVCYSIFVRSWITTNDVLAFEDPSNFCQTCFDLLHYDEHKRKLHAFDAYWFDGNYAP